MKIDEILTILYLLQARRTEEGLCEACIGLRCIGCCQQDRNHINAVFRKYAYRDSSLKYILQKDPEKHVYSVIFKELTTIIVKCSLTYFEEF